MKHPREIYESHNSRVFKRIRDIDWCPILFAPPSALDMAIESGRLNILDYTLIHLPLRVFDGDSIVQ